MLRRILIGMLNLLILALVFACALVGSSVMVTPPEREPGFELPPIADSIELPSTQPPESAYIPDTEADAEDELDEEPDPQQEQEQEPEPEPGPEYFTIAMMGDCTLGADHSAKGNAYAFESIVGDNYAYPFSIAKPLYEDASFVIVNLECAMTDYNVPSSNLFNMRAPAEYVNILLEGGVDFVALGNNHTMDFGQRGYAETQETLLSNRIGFAPNGGWNLFIAEGGLTIGVYSKNMANEADVIKAAEELKSAGAEVIIMALHWGDEGSYRPTEGQKQVGRTAIDAGAHIIMGTHPHTLQPVELYNGGIIYYSIGNWSFGGHTNPRDKDSIIAKVTIMRDLDGAISISGMENIPCSVSGVAEFNDYRPVPYEVGTEEFARTMSKLDGSFTGPNLVVSYGTDDEEEAEEIETEATQPDNEPVEPSNDNQPADDTPAGDPDAQDSQDVNENQDTPDDNEDA